MLKYYKITFLLLLLSQVASGQRLQFEKAINDGGLPQIPLALHQDNHGFIWIGTTDGFYRYDGREVKEFRYDATDSTSISNSYVKAIFEDRKGNIWLGTQNGLNCYHPEKEQFTRYFTKDEQQKDKGNYIHDVIEDHEGNIWFGTYNGLFLLDPETHEYTRFLPEIEQKKTLSNKLVWSVFEDDQHRIWAGTHQGFTVFENKAPYDFRPFYGGRSESGGLTADRIFDITQQQDGTIWLSTNDGIFKVIENDSAFQFQQIKHEPDQINSLSGNIVYELLPDQNNRLWAATYKGGLNELVFSGNKNEGLQFFHYRHQPEKRGSISFDRIESILIDYSGLLWVGTARQLDKASTTTNKFRTLTSSAKNPASLSNDIIKSIYKDSFGNLWVGTFSGLNFLSADNLKAGKYSFERFKYDPNDLHSISNNNIEGINEDSRGYLWVSTHNGLNYCNIPEFLKNKKFSHIDNKKGIPHTFNTNLKEIREGEYWLTCNGALAKMFFDPQNPENIDFERFEMDDRKEGAIVNSHTTDVIQDRFGDYWVGTFDGVSKCIESEQSIYFENYKNELTKSASLSNNSFRCFFKDRKNRLWIGTRSGLNLVEQPEKNQRASFKVYGNKDGFPNDVIHAIEEDTKGQLWISTNKGLVVFDPEDSKNPVKKIYTAKDGLASSSFVFRASFRDDLGNLYFGTANGLNYFHPDKIPRNNYVPPVRFTKLKVLNKVVKPRQEKKSILKKTITLTDKITLRHWQNIIALEFAALDFNKPENNQYQYKLSSLNEDWVSLGNTNTVTFTNLSSGNHTLLVKGSNNDGVWNETPARLIVEVLPPPWKTWWAYLLYGLAVIGLIYAFLKFRIRQKVRLIEEKAKIEKARFEERELLRKQNAADFHDELGHRLTKISLFLELANRQAEEAIKPFLAKIKTHSSGLSEGIRDLIWSLDPQKDSLYQTMLRLQEFGDKLFDYSNVKFKTTGINENLDAFSLEPDVRKQLLLIFKEAMNNCLKYAGCSNAQLSIHKTENSYKITFSDDGKGFEQSEVKKGYGLKNMQQRADKIKAKLKLESTASGTIIMVTLKA